MCIRDRLEALELSLSGKDGVAALLEAAPKGVVGAVASMVQVDAGFEPAIPAALGWAAEAVVVKQVKDAPTALPLSLLHN